MGIKDAIKDKTFGTEEMLIKQKLNSLFYLPAVPRKEAKMIIRQAEQTRVRTGLHASAILSSDQEFCYREQVLSLFYHMAQGENIPTKLKRIFEQGTSIGEKWQRLFLRGKLGRIKDMDISQFAEEYDLSFTPDAIITINNKKYIVEIKSQNSFIFDKEKTHSSGMKQLRLYMWLSGIHNGFVLVDNKNTQEFKVLLAKHDKEKIEKYKERLENIQKLKRIFLTKKKPPKRICPNSRCKRAQKCGMVEACFNIGKGRQKLK